MAQRSARERQRECRARKKKEGHYISLFVPHNVYEKIKGRPRLLVECFFANEELIEIIVELDKKNRALSLQLEDFIREARRLEEEHEKIYMRKRIRSLYDIRHSNKYFIEAEKDIYNYYYIPLALTTYKQQISSFKREIKDYISFLKLYLNKWYITSEHLKKELKRFFDNQKREQQNEIESSIEMDFLKSIYNICWQLYEDKLRFDITDRQQYGSLLKKFESLEKFDPQKLSKPTNT